MIERRRTTRHDPQAGPEQPDRQQLIERNTALRRRVERLRQILRDRARAERGARYPRVQVDLLRKMIRHCQRAPDVESALGHILHDICQQLNWPVGHVYLPEPDDSRPQRMVPGGFWHLADRQRYASFREITEQTDFQRGEGLIGRAWASGEPLWDRDIHEDPRCKRARLAPELPVVAGLAVPLVYYGRTLAVLEFFAERVIEPEDLLMAMFEELAGALATLAERKRAEAALEHRAAQFYRSLRKAPAPLVTLDPEGVIRFWNRAAAEAFGYSRNEAAGRQAEALLAERYRSLVRRYLKRGPRQRARRWRTLIAEAVMPDGEQRPIEAAVRPTVRTDDAAFIVVAQDIGPRRALEQRMREEHERLRAVLTEHHTSEQRHREALAETLHEHIAQMLAAAQMQLKGLRDAPSSEELGERMAEVDDVIRRALQDVRHISYDLSPPALHELGLEPAVAWLARRLDEQHGLRLEVDDDGRDKPLSSQARRTLFHAIRELLTNVASRAGAERAVLRMAVRDGDLRIEVVDPGGALAPGEEAAGAEHRLGLVNLNEQVMAIGGAVDLRARPGEGTSITLSVPLERGDKE